MGVWPDAFILICRMCQTAGGLFFRRPRGNSPVVPLTRPEWGPYYFCHRSLAICVSLRGIAGGGAIIALPAKGEARPPDRQGVRARYNLPFSLTPTSVFSFHCNATRGAPPSIRVEQNAARIRLNG